MEYTGAASQTAGVVEGKSFPDFNLSRPELPEDRHYLGLTEGTDRVSVATMEVNTLLIVVFHELCSLCQQQTVTFKQLFKRINSDEALAKRVRMIGLPIGGKRRTLASYKKEFQVPYPLLADTNRELFESLGRPLLPAVFLLQRTNAQTYLIRKIWTGYEGGVEELLAAVQELN